MMTDRHCQKKTVAYIASSSSRYAVFGLLAYQLYYRVTNPEGMPLREALVRFGFVLFIGFIIGLLISSLTWRFKRKKSLNDDYLM